MCNVVNVTNEIRVSTRFFHGTTDPPVDIAGADVEFRNILTQEVVPPTYRKVIQKSVVTLSKPLLKFLTAPTSSFLSVTCKRGSQLLSEVSQSPVPSDEALSMTWTPTNSPWDKALRTAFFRTSNLLKVGIKTVTLARVRDMFKSEQKKALDPSCALHSHRRTD